MNDIELKKLMEILDPEFLEYLKIVEEHIKTLHLCDTPTYEATIDKDVNDIDTYYKLITRVEK